MIYFIACHAPDFQGAKVADGLARVSLRNKSPHLAFSTRELAQYYLDSRNATKLCYPIYEDDLKEVLWFDFSDGIILFDTLKEVRKSLRNTDYLSGVKQMSYCPSLQQSYA